MAFKHLVVPWAFGGALVLGYATFAWLRGKRGNSPQVGNRGESRTSYEPAPLSDQLERVPEELALAPELEAELPANNNSGTRGVELGALFLGRASSSLSPFSNPSFSAPRHGRVPVPR